MRRTIIYLALLLLLTGSIVLLPAWPTHAVVPQSYRPFGPGNTYLALGDSLTTGKEASANNDNLPGYPANVYQQLQAKYPALASKNLGKDGETSQSLLKDGQLAAAEAFIASEIANGRRVSPITLSIGGNDAANVLLESSTSGEQALQTFKTNLATILNRLQTAMTDVYAKPQGDLLIMDYYNPYPGLRNPLTGELVADGLAKLFNAAVKEAAAKYNLPVAEVAQAFSGKEAELLFVNQEIYKYPGLLDSKLNPNFEKDLDYHPRAKGHQIIAEQFFNVSGYGPLKLEISGPEKGASNTSYTFKALSTPLTSTASYTWAPVPATGQGTVQATYTWASLGPKTITVTATDATGTITTTHTITITDLVQLAKVVIVGPTMGTTETTYPFTATIEPANATLPISYTWQPAPTSKITNTASYTWRESGVYTITVIAANPLGTVTKTQKITIQAPPIAPNNLLIKGPSGGELNTPYTFTVTVPNTVTKPLTYVWQPTPTSQITETATYQWAKTGLYTLTVTASNKGGTATYTHPISIEEKTQQVKVNSVFLPLVQR